MIIGSFGLILTPEHINSLNNKIINIHPGILPECRGRHPLPQAIINKDEYMGMTAHVLTKKIDYGNIVALEKLKINYNQSYRDNERKLLNIFAAIFDEIIEKLETNSIEFSDNHAMIGNYYPPLTKDTLEKVINCKLLKELSTQK